jgi:hypothetical protein
VKWLLVLAACGAGEPATTFVVDNGRIAGGHEIGLVELGGSVFAGERAHLTISRGEEVRRVAAPDGGRWDALATIAAPGGEGRWVVGLANGDLWRISDAGALERVTEQLGGVSGRVRSVDGAGPTFAVSGSEGVAASPDGRRLLMFARTDAPGVAVARAKVALWRAGAIEVLDLARNAKRTFALAGVDHVAFLDPNTQHARLAAISRGRLFVESGGQLVEVPLPGAADELAVAGSRVWIRAGTQLFIYERGRLERARLTVPPAARLAGSPSGDIWIGAVRYTIAKRDDPAWHAQVEPVFRRVCARCHEPGSAVDIDLSRPGHWLRHRDVLFQRVVVERTMPPEASELSDADRAQLARWLEQ